MSIEQIVLEDWHEAPGVIVSGTNSALADRDYSKQCRLNYEIALVKGYHIWWCSTHHQPHSYCQSEKLKDALRSELLKVLE